MSKYNTKLKEELKKEKLMEELETIKKRAKEIGWNDELEKDYNKIQLRNILIRKKMKGRSEN